MIGRQKQSEIAKLLLIGLGIGLLIPASVIAPGATEILKAFRRKPYNKFSKKEICSALRRMRRSELIATAEYDDKVILRLTDKGKRRSIAFNFETISLDTNEQWDGYWRVVIFDIPERLKQSRELFRNKIRLLGFHMLQKSVWLTSHKCRDQIFFLTNLLEISSFVVVFETKNINTRTHLYKPFQY